MNRLKELRQEKGMSLSKLSKTLKEKYDVSISTSQLMYYEKGEREPRNKQVWEKLADFFGVNTAYLLGYSDFPAGNLRELLTHEVKALKEYEVVRVGGRNFISENQVLNIIDKYVP